MKEGIEHESEESQPVKASQRGGQSFIVSGKSPETSSPGKGTLDHPSSWQKNKSPFGFLEFDYYQSDSLPGCFIGRFFTGVTLIDKSRLHALASNLLHVFDQIADLRPLLLVGWRDFQSQEMAQSIHRHMHFGTLPALVSIVASPASAFRGGLQRASIRITAEGCSCFCASIRSTWRRSCAIASKHPALIQRAAC